MSSTDQQAAELRPVLHQMWNSVAPSWAEHAETADARTAGVTAAMLRRADLRPGQRVLELACGAGGVGLAAAARVAPGEVVISDVARAMVAVARARAERLGLPNVSVRVLDLEAIAAPDGGFDATLCREGLMLVPDPARAAREMLRVVRPGGHAVAAVWGPREANPWLGAIFDAVSEHLGAPMPPAGVPGPFALSDGDALAVMLTDAGWYEVEVEAVATPLEAPSAEAWWTEVTALAGPLAGMLGALPEEVSRAIRASALAAVADFVAPDGALEIPGLTLIASGTT